MDMYTQETTAATEDRTCPELDDVSGAYRSSQPSSPHYTVNTVIQYACVYTHSLESGNLTRVCQENGAWSGIAPRCVRDNGNAYMVGGIIAAVGLIILAIFPADFIRYQRKKARIREHSQRRSADCVNRPSAYFIQSLPSSNKFSHSDPPTTRDVGECSSGQAVPQPDVTLPPLTPGNKACYTQSTFPPMDSNSRNATFQDQQEKSSKSQKKRKRKLIPKQNAAEACDHHTDNLNLQIQSVSADPLYPETSAMGKRIPNKKKKKMKVGPNAEEAICMNAYHNPAVDFSEQGPPVHHNASGLQLPQSDRYIPPRPSYGHYDEQYWTSTGQRVPADEGHSPVNQRELAPLRRATPRVTSDSDNISRQEGRSLPTPIPPPHANVTQKSQINHTSDPRLHNYLTHKHSVIMTTSKPLEDYEV